MPVSISIIIVSYNVRYFLEQCLLSVRRSAVRLDAEVIVVDNHSADGTLAYLQPLFPEVLFVAAGANLGFARACNLGFRRASASHVLFLNPDTLLGEDSLEQVLRFAHTHPDAGAVGVRMLDGSGRFLKESKRGFPGPLPSLFKLSGLASLLPRSAVFSRYYLGHLSPECNQQVDVVAGAFMFVSRRVLEQAGLFDETFFMYGEDIDLSYRIQRAGFQNHYVAGTAIIHFKGESSRRHSASHVHIFYKAMELFVRKHYRRSGAFRVVLRTAIWLRAGLALATKPLLRLKPQASAAEMPLAIFAADDSYATLERALRQQGRSATRLQHLHEAGQLRKGQQLVLCTSRLTLREYIRWMDSHRLDLCYLFHQPGSGALVGSPSADDRGSFLTLAALAERRPGPFSLVN